MPTTNPPHCACSSVPSAQADGGVTLQEVTYASPVNGMITATFVSPPGPGPHPGVLFVHWLGEAATTNRTEFMDDALALGRAGSASLLVDALWSTNAPGKPSYDTAMTIEQVIDLRRDLDALLAQPGVDSTRIAYVGHDFGAMYGCILLAVDHRATYGVLHDSDQPLERLGSAHQPAERRRTGRLHPAHGHLRPSSESAAYPAQGPVSAIRTAGYLCVAG